MASERRKVKLGFSIWASGQHPAGWRLPEASAHGTFDPGFMRDAARAAERGKLDYYFVGDRVVGAAVLPVRGAQRGTAARGADAGRVHRRRDHPHRHHHHGQHHLLRPVHGRPGHRRAGPPQPRPDGLEHRHRQERGGRGQLRPGSRHSDSDRRYSWTSEFIEVVRGLWDTWEDDALVADKGTGQFIDEAKVHRLNYRGRHFSVNGPINIARPPQGHVPMLHAGTSVESHEFGARYCRHPVHPAPGLRGRPGLLPRHQGHAGQLRPGRGPAAGGRPARVRGPHRPGGARQVPPGPEPDRGPAEPDQAVRCPGRGRDRVPGRPSAGPDPGAGRADRAARADREPGPACAG